MPAERIVIRHRPRFASQPDARDVARHTVEIRAALRRECLETVETSRLVEGFGVELQRGVRGEYSRAAARRFLGVPRVWRTVCAEKEARIVAGRGLNKRRAVATPSAYDFNAAWGSSSTLSRKCASSIDAAGEFLSKSTACCSACFASCKLCFGSS